ncbi:Ph-response regulator protein palh rim21 [Nocardioides sp. PD653]|nr:Ph-response regulator protein palh rim21 [Nocardioides sp. PD653-B2]GAW53798.1 Ph-response regulator protein palh rim21 [Nocardioides sp. PD653]
MPAARSVEPLTAARATPAGGRAATDRNGVVRGGAGRPPDPPGPVWDKPARWDTVSPLHARVAERQTRWLQVPVSERAWGFKSPLAHVSSPGDDLGLYSFPELA